MVVDAMRRAFTGVLAVAFVGLAGDASAAGVGGGRATEETMLVVWDAAKSTEHLVFGAHIEANGASGVVLAIPAGTALEPVPGAVAGFGVLGQDVKPRPMGPAQALLTSPTEKLALAGTDAAGLLAWIRAEQSLGKTLATLPISRDEPSQDTGYAHVSFTTTHAFLPFASPDDAPPRGTPTIAPSREHPPRIRLWVELGTETKTGAWERSMDAMGETLRPALVDCYVDASSKRAPTGDIHVQARLAPGAAVELEDPTASSKAMEGVAACFARAVEKASWPAVTGPRAAPFLVHASMRPPSASTRLWRAFVLSTQNADPRLGSADDPRTPPDTRVVSSYEPSPERLLAAFDAQTRQALGIDTTKRWRFLLIESTADPRPEIDDIALRPLEAAIVLPPGVPPLPMIARGDLPEGTRMPASRHSRWKSRKLRWALGIGVVAALFGAAIWADSRRRRAAA